MYRIDNWNNEGSGWLVESIDGEYVNISVYSSLVGNTCIELSDELKHPMKGPINIKNNKCFLWCHVRHLNLVESNPQRLTKENRKLGSKLDYERIDFPVSKKMITVKLKSKIISVLMFFVVVHIR